MVLRLDPLAKFGALVVVTGIALALWARGGGPDWTGPVGKVVMVGGLLVYLTGRFRRRRS